jgi:hypothetical protein
MVALGIESGRERQHVGGAKLHTETASFTALYNDGNASFCHLNSTFNGGQADYKISDDYDFGRYIAM